MRAGAREFLLKLWCNDFCCVLLFVVVGFKVNEYWKTVYFFSRLFIFIFAAALLNVQCSSLGWQDFWFWSFSGKRRRQTGFFVC